ncbi:DUF2818 family protein [Zoogloea sp.]|uniref:DUF2818 family protein n=1 Tax=Zoogloea sp. TaxID=49181 RepID=UPI002618FD95|nr:DUF2818 family protein [Zoogloea sp.]MDD3353850.1 DUF2818 family protein [Zoogloea sp.]
MVWLILAGLFCLANLPFFTRRFLLILPIRGNEKGIGTILLELVLLFLFSGALLHHHEGSQFGTPYRQGWEFYAICACLFLVAAFPGFVRRFLWRSA